jgi:ketosteroid isomerase-like protein
MQWEGSEHSAGPSEIEFAAVLGMGRDDALETIVQFDLDDLDAAYAELDARYAAGEAAAHPSVPAAWRRFSEAFARRDWEAVAAGYSADVVVHDHRLLGWEPIRGAPAYVDSLRTLVELAPDVQIRSDHIALNARGLFWVGRWSGTREGGPFDSPWIVVSEHDAAGRVQRFDTYDLDQQAAARARFAELTAEPLRIPPNEATRFDERLMAVIEAHDWEGAAALIAEDASFEDRRRGFLLSGGRDLLLTNIRYLGSRGVRSTATTLATAGDRLALQRFLYTGSEGAAPFEIENLQLTEVDAEGRLLAAIVFDLDARRAASDEMFVRFRRGEGAGHALPSFIEFVLAMHAHDRERACALLPEDFVFDDHRRTGVGRLGNADDYVASLTALWDESPDVSTETLYYIDFAEHGALNVGRMFGTLSGGGEFESLFVRLACFRGGQFVGAELFELEDLERARARFEELRPDPLRIPPNAASRFFDRVAEAFRAWDPAALRALASADFRFEDLRRRALVSGDVELWIRNLEVVRSYPGLRTTLELIGTVGDRIALERLSFIADPEGSAFEGEFLRLTEVDAEGKIRAWIHFDPEDRGAAFAEAQARFAAGEAAGSEAQAAITAFSGSFRRRDWAACHGCYTGDAVVQDHRRLGFGSVSIDGWIESWRVLVELAPDVSAEQFRILAWSERGRVSVMRQHGTREGGPFESVFVGVFLTRGAQIERYEIFDLEDAERALARFAELSAG